MEGGRGIKRKKKRSLLSRLKKYSRGAKVSSSPRGTQLEEDIYKYFIRVMEVEKQGFDTKEDKACFVTNVFEETIGKEVDYSGNQLVSRVLESLVPSADDATLVRFNDAFASQIRIVCVDPFASHVLQSMLLESADRVRRGIPDSDRLSDFVLRTGRFVLNNMEEFIWDQYANHVGRTCLAALVGCPSDGDRKSTPPTGKKDVPAVKSEEGVPMSEDGLTLAKEFATRILAWGQLPDLCSADLPSGFLQRLLIATRLINKSLAQKLVGRLLNECFATGDNDGAVALEEDGKEEKDKKLDSGATSRRLPIVFTSMATKRLLETALGVASSKKFTQIYARVFINRLACLSLDSNANLCVQKLLRCCREKVDFESMFGEMAPKFREIVGVGNTGVIQVVAETCERLSVKQNDFMINLSKALDCFEPDTRQDSFAVCILQMKSYGAVMSAAKTDEEESGATSDKKKSSVNIHGSLIVQAMLRFKKPIKVINSLMSTDAAALCDIFCDPKGCHVVDAFTTSVHVGEKSRERLINKLKGRYVKLAEDRHGSRCFDCIWARAGPGHRTRIASDLSTNESTLVKSEYGRIIASKIMLDEFRHRRDVWVKTVAEGHKPGSGEKAKALFKDLIAGVEAPKAEVC